ncbi:MAG: MBL fold metallo-hydrolase [Acidobacteriota bacterium]
MKPCILGILLCVTTLFAQDKPANPPEISVRIIKAAGNVYFLDCVDGFGGGNVAASIGDDGILIVDDMYAAMGPKLLAALKTISDKPVRIVLNTHFHGDHIQGNKNFQKTSVIIAHENVRKRLLVANTSAKPTLDMLPAVTYSDRLTINFNGEEVQIVHFPNGHTDGDSVIYFTESKVLHLGDMFFFEMFPAVYAEGGGNIRQLVVNLDTIIADFPADAKVVPGHGNLATMQDLKNYVAMLKSSIAIVDSAMKQGKTLEQATAEKVLAKYDTLGSGGAQTTDQYLAMLYKLLSVDKK